MVGWKVAVLIAVMRDEARDLVRYSFGRELPVTSHIDPDLVGHQVIIGPHTEWRGQDVSRGDDAATTVVHGLCRRGTQGSFPKAHHPGPLVPSRLLPTPDPVFGIIDIPLPTIAACR